MLMRRVWSSLAILLACLSLWYHPTNKQATVAAAAATVPPFSFTYGDPPQVHIKGTNENVSSSIARSGNYHWAMKIMGRNDPNNATHPANCDLIFEVGSRDLRDGNSLAHFFDAVVYSFEPNPENHGECEENNKDPRVHLVKSAVSLVDGSISFFPYNLSLYANRGAGSVHMSDFVTNRNVLDHDYKREPVQYEVKVPSTRLDTFITKVSKRVPDMLCLDVQEAEKEVLESAGEFFLRRVKFIVLETSVAAQYVNGSVFDDIHKFLESRGFEFKAMKYLNGKNAIHFKIPAKLSGGADVFYINKLVDITR